EAFSGAAAGLGAAAWSARHAKTVDAGRALAFPDVKARSHRLAAGGARLPSDRSNAGSRRHLRNFAALVVSDSLAAGELGKVGFAVAVGDLGAVLEALVPRRAILDGAAAGALDAAALGARSHHRSAAWRHPRRTGHRRSHWRVRRHHRRRA